MGAIRYISRHFLTLFDFRLICQRHPIRHQQRPNHAENCQEAQNRQALPDFPLFRHQNGQWVKKIRGKLYYFGIDADAALRKYTAERDDLQAGRTPRATPATGITVTDLCNRFLTAKKRLQDVEELSPLTWAATTTLAKSSFGSSVGISSSPTSAQMIVSDSAATLPKVAARMDSEPRYAAFARYSSSHSTPI